MAELRPQVTRTLSIFSAMGGWYFTIEEDGEVYMESPLYETSDRCVEEGMKYMDALHEEKPLLCNYIPTSADFIYLVKEEKKDENG